MEINPQDLLDDGFIILREVVPPGEPTVERAGPLLPALATGCGGGGGGSVSYTPREVEVIGRSFFFLGIGAVAGYALNTTAMRVQ